MFVGKESLRISFWFVWFEKKELWLPVVYDSVRKTIVTFLPKNALGTAPPLPGSAETSDFKAAFLSEAELRELLATFSEDPHKKQ